MSEASREALCPPSYATKRAIDDGGDGHHKDMGRQEMGRSWRDLKENGMSAHAVCSQP